MFAFRSVVVAFAFTMAACAAEAEPASSTDARSVDTDLAAPAGVIIHDARGDGIMVPEAHAGADDADGVMIPDARGGADDADGVMVPDARGGADEADGVMVPERK